MYTFAMLSVRKYQKTSYHIHELFAVVVVASYFPVPEALWFVDELDHAAMDMPQVARFGRKDKGVLPETSPPTPPWLLDTSTGHGEAISVKPSDMRTMGSARARNLTLSMFAARSKAQAGTATKLPVWACGWFLSVWLGLWLVFAQMSSAQCPCRFWFSS